MADVRKVWADRIRIERKDRGWDKPEMARQLAHAAGDARTRLPSHDSLLSYVKRWERGAVGISERYRLLYAAAFGLAEEDVFSEEEADVNRREFVGSSLVAGLTLRVPKAARTQERFPAASGSPTAAADAEAVVASVRGALFGPVTDGAESIAAETLNRQAVHAWKLRQAAEYGELADLLTHLLADTRAAIEHVNQEPQDPAVTRAYVHTHNAASSLMKRTAPELAAVAADRSVQAARRLGDDVLVGAAVLRLANVFLASGRHRQAVDTAADGAQALLPHMGASPAALATWGALLLTAAIGAAQLGDGPGAAWEFLGQARVAAGMLREDYADLHAVFGPQNVAIHGVQIATELGDPREALRRAEKVNVERLSASLLERRSTLLIDIARCHYLVGDSRDALVRLVEAERLAPEEVRYSGVAHQLAAGLLHSPVAKDADLRQLVVRMKVQA